VTDFVILGKGCVGLLGALGGVVAGIYLIVQKANTSTLNTGLKIGYV
jgi:hypothetical protein